MAPPIPPPSTHEPTAPAAPKHRRHKRHAQQQPVPPEEPPSPAPECGRAPPPTSIAPSVDFPAAPATSEAVGPSMDIPSTLSRRPGTAGAQQHQPGRPSRAAGSAEAVCAQNLISYVQSPAPSKPGTPDPMLHVEVIEEVKDRPGMAGVGREGDGFGNGSEGNIAQNLVPGARDVFVEMPQRPSIQGSDSSAPRMVIGCFYSEWKLRSFANAPRRDNDVAGRSWRRRI